MRQKHLIFSSIVFVAMLFNAATAGIAQRPDPSGRGRYTITGNEIYHQPQYTGPATVDGLGLKSAGELGLTGKRAYNEFPSGPKLITLSAQAMIFYDTGSMEPLYLDNCRVNGKYRPNRIKLEEVVTVEKEKIVTQKEIVKVEVPVEKIVTVQKDCIDCSVFVITDAEFVSKGFGTRLPSFTEILVAGIDGAVSSAIFSNEDRGKAALYGVIGSEIKTFGYNFVKRDKNALALTVNGVSFVVQKKKGPVTVNKGEATLIIEWVSKNQIVGRLASDRSICFTAYLENAFTVGTVTVVFKGGEKRVIPVKEQSPNAIPNPGGIWAGGHGIPGGRPQIGNTFVDYGAAGQNIAPSNGQSGQSFNFVPNPQPVVFTETQPPAAQSSSSALPPGYRRIEINGVVHVVKVQ
jgi:hypothetical protein